MPDRYENPVLYSFVNQPVDKKTGLVVQQEVPITQLGRMSQKHDQGFLDFVADRAVSKYYGKKGKRGTGIFLPDRIRFTRKLFRDKLFYREIKEFYKSDPQTFCFVLYVFDEKTAKRTYEVYQCDTLQDVRRIEDLLEMSKHTINRLLVDPVPEPPLSEKRRSLSMPPERETVVECPHCNHLSVVLENDRSSIVSGPLSGPTCRSDKYAAPKYGLRKAKSAVALDQQDEWVHINDRWRESPVYSTHNGAKPLKRRIKTMPPDWYDMEHDGDYEYVIRRIKPKAANPKYQSDIQVRPYHSTSTYGRPQMLNRDEEIKRALRSGKPRLNRETMQIEEPYVIQPQTRTKPLKSLPDSTRSNDQSTQVAISSQPKNMSAKPEIYRLGIQEQNEKPHPNTVNGNSHSLIVPSNQSNQQNYSGDVPILPVRKNAVSRAKTVMPTPSNGTILIERKFSENGPYPNYEVLDETILGAMYAERFVTSPSHNTGQTVISVLGDNQLNNRQT